MHTFTTLRNRNCRSGGWLVALILLLTSPAAFAQLTGAYTINSAQATGGTNYASFTAAVAALTTGGVSGPVTFTVSGGPYTEQVSLASFTGASAANRVTFNGSGQTIQFGSNVSAQRAVITLNGADYVTINNLTVDATVGGTSTATYGWGIQLLNSSDNNIISNCTVTAATSGTTTNFAGIVSNASTTSPTTTGTTASQNLTLQNNTVTGGYYGITVVGSGSTTAPTPGIRITGNTVSNCHDAGIYIGYLSGAQITGNDISRPSRTGASSFYGLNMNVGTSGTTVAKNRIHQAFPAGTTTTSGAYGIYLFTLAAATATTPNYIVNNLIYDLSGSAVYGIFNGSSDNSRFYYNTIDINDQANASTGGGFGFYQTTGLNVEFRNNIVRLSRTGTGLNYGIFLSSIVPSFVSNSNDLVGSGSTYRTGFFQTSPYATLADWSTANGGTFDQNSVSVEPQFVSLATGNLQPTAVALNGIGAPLTAVTDDFTGAARSTTTPDLGAYEFTPPANTASVALRSIDSPAAPLALGARTVTVTISNNGTAPLTTVQLQYVFNGAAPVSQTLTPAGGLAVGATQSFSFTAPVTLISGRNALTVTAGAPNGNTAVSSSLSRTFYTPMVGTYTINKLAAASGTNFLGFAEAAITLNNSGIAGSVRLNVLNGPYAEQFSLGVIAGVSATDTIVVDGGTAKQRLTYVGQAAQPAAVLLNGTDYLTLQNLTVDMAASAQYGIGVHLVGQTTNIRIRSCVILAPSVSTNTTLNAGIVVSGGLTSMTSAGDASGLRIENDSISGGAAGVSLTGLSAASRATGLRITGTVIREFFQYGIYLVNHAGAQIVNNNIHRETRVSTIAFYGVYLVSSVSTNIERNRIHDPNTGSGSALPVYGIYSTSSPATAGAENDVVNNLLYNLNSYGTTYGIYNSGSSYARYYHNTLILDSQRSSSSTVMGFYQSSAATNVDFRNNLVIVTQPATLGRYAVNFATTTSGIVSNYNDLYVGPGPDAYTGRFGTTDYVTLADWRTANANAYDQNSVQVNTIFPVAGSLQPGSATLDGAGTPTTLARVPRDFANVTRNNPPDIGAYEFSTVANDVELVSIDSPTATVLAATSPVTVTIRNNGSSVLTSLTLSYVLDNGTPVTQAFTGLTLAYNTTQPFTFTQGVALAFGTHTFTVTASLPNGLPDANAANNALTISTQQLTPPNDEPCTAIALGAAPINASNFAATTSAQNGINLPSCAGGALPKDVWFTFTPSGTSTTLTLTGAPAGAIRIFTSPSCSAGPFTQVFCQGSGANNTALGPVTVTGLTAGTRYYAAVSGYGGSDTGGAFTISATAILATRTSNNAALSVFPNPSNTGQLTLRLSASAGAGSVALLNTLGQVVHQQPLTSGAEQQVSTRGLAAGLYTLRLQMGTEVLTRKVVLQ